MPIVTCRFLRVIPIDCEKGGAMRIGIYGKDNCNDKTKPTAPTNVATGESMVEYTLYQPSPFHAVNADVRDFCGLRRYGRDPPFAQQERRDLRARARQEQIERQF
jgi:hypothetical protein